MIGDKLVITGEVSGVYEMFRQIEVKAHILNQYGEKISRAKIKITRRINKRTKI